MADFHSWSLDNLANLAHELQAENEMLQTAVEQLRQDLREAMAVIRDLNRKRNVASELLQALIEALQDEEDRIRSGEHSGSDVPDDYEHVRNMKALIAKATQP